jgi:hypothetical protein
MRYSLILAAVLTAVPVCAQTSTQGVGDLVGAAAEYPYGLDPYKPSDAQFLREWGDVLVQQTPLSELARLDPYKPSEAALRRRIGAGLPVPVSGFLYYPPSDRLAVWPAPGAAPVAGSAPPESAAPAASAAPSAGAAPVSAKEMSTVSRPENNDGIWIRFEGQKWISAGVAVPIASPGFTRVGDYAGVPVYRRQGSDDVIYLPTRQGYVAPYRRKP